VLGFGDPTPSPPVLPKSHHASRHLELEVKGQREFTDLNCERSLKFWWLCPSPLHRHCRHARLNARGNFRYPGPSTRPDSYLSPVTMAMTTVHSANHTTTELEAKIKRFLANDHPVGRPKQGANFLSNGKDLLLATETLTSDEQARFVDKVDQVRRLTCLSVITSQRFHPQSCTRPSAYVMPTP